MELEVGYVTITFTCINCGAITCASPNKVPCLVIEGKKKPLCKTCADKWNQINWLDKDLEHLNYGDAYDVPFTEE
jgi:hypothetical protein